MTLGEIAPTAEALLALEADELGLRMLPLLIRAPDFYSPAHGRPLSLKTVLDANFPTVYPVGGGSQVQGLYPVQHNDSVIRAISEAWAWLEGQGLLTPALGAYNEPNPTVRIVSRRGHRLAEDPQVALSAKLLPKDTLHPIIREDVWGLFHRGKYDTAVFEAMKAVEIAVREAGGFAAVDLGVDLMRKAFNPENGCLTDMSTTAGERGARSALFAGAIGSYKNPQSHRKVALDDPDEAAEIIMLACHLLRIVDARRHALEKGDRDGVVRS